MAAEVFGDQDNVGFNMSHISTYVPFSLMNSSGPKY